MSFNIARLEVAPPFRPYDWARDCAEDLAPRHFPPVVGCGRGYVMSEPYPSLDLDRIRHRAAELRGMSEIEALAEVTGSTKLVGIVHQNPCIADALKFDGLGA